MAKQKIEDGSAAAGRQYGITITEKGPYLVYGRPPLALQYIMLNDRGESWYFQEGRHFSTEAEPTALCRCGASRHKPYCDGSHVTHRWNPELEDMGEALLDNVEITEGERVSLTDNKRYCTFARFCDAAGGVWDAAESSSDSGARELTLREASMCPGGRLMAWDNDTGRPFEFRFEPSLGLVEDPSADSSGGLWVRGGIRIRREDGRSYEIRNRCVLCRCGASDNKPYCDGTHAALRWRDELEGMPEGETVPEKVH